MPKIPSFFRVNWMEPELMFTREPISGYEIYLGLEELESDAPAPGQLDTATVSHSKTQQRCFISAIN